MKGQIISIKLKKIIELAKSWVKQDIGLALAITVAMVLIGIVIGYESNRVIPITKITVNTYTLEPKNFLKFLSNWDGAIYLNIAKNGYNHNYLVNFFPFYPLIVSLVHKAVSSVLDSGLIVAWVFMVGTFYYYIKIVKEYFQLKKQTILLKQLFC